MLQIWSPVKITLFILIFTAMLPASASAAFRCGTSLVDEGDWPVEVEERCGEPDYVAIYPSAVLPGIGVVREVEHWYYNPGPQGFIRRLEFRDGVLRNEHSLGYGFAGDNDGHCSVARLQQGTTEFELVARCGEPVSKRVTWQSLSPRRQHGYTGAQALVPVEEWLYEFGDNRFRRIITLQNGRITQVETAKKPR